MSGISPDIQALLNAPTAQDYQAKELTNQYNSNVVQAQELQAKQNQLALAKQQQMQALQQKALANYLGKPQDAQAFAIASALNPDLVAGIKQGYEAADANTKKQILIDSTDLHSYANAGDYKGVTKVIQRSIDADTAAGVDTSDDQHILDLATKADAGDEAAANELKGWAQLHAYAIGDDAFKKNFVDTLKAPAEINKLQTAAAKDQSDINVQESKLPIDNALTQAQTQKTQVETGLAPALAQSTIENNAADSAWKYAQTATAQQAMTEVPQALLPKVIEVQDKAASSQVLADQLKGLADKFEQAAPSGGIGASAASILTGITGDQSSITQLREQYKNLRASLAFTKLPPGSSSDQDVKFALSGFPPDNADAATMTKFLRGTAKIQQQVAQYNDYKAQFMTQNRGNPTIASKPIFVDDMLIDKGETFDSAINKKYELERKQAAKDAIESNK